MNEDVEVKSELFKYDFFVVNVWIIGLGDLLCVLFDFVIWCVCLCFGM